MKKKFSLFNLDDVSEKQFLNALSFYVLSKKNMASISTFLNYIAIQLKIKLK
jgi:hypothetical protein